MADDELRKLERRWRESADPQDGGAYLNAAVRAGLFERNQVELAADLGDLAARAARGDGPFLEADLEGWGKLLRERWGQTALVRVSLAVTHALLPEEELASGFLLAAREVLAALEAWLACPCREHSNAARRIRNQTNDEAFRAWAGPERSDALEHTFWSAVYPPARGSWSTRGCEAPEYAAKVLGLERVLEVVADQVVPWALGQSS